MNFNDSVTSTFEALEFIRPYWLVGIVVVLLFSLWRYKGQSNQQTTIIANHLSEHLVTLPETTKSNRLTLNLLAVIACVALSGPSIRSVELPVYEMQTAQVIALDLSYSMYATDIKPDRLSRAKYKAIDLLKLWTEGEKGLIAYAGDAFTITPLTKDSNSIINHIPNLSPDLMPARGSRPDLALEKAISLLKNAGYQQGHIVFISDGFDSDGFDKASADKMQEMVKGTKWMVSVLGIGTPGGAAIKLQDGSLLKDSNGNIVIPKLEANTLTPITQISDGVYLNFDASGKDVTRLATQFTDKHIDKQQSNTTKSTENKQLIDDGYWLSFLLIPLFLLLFRKGVFYAALFTIMLPLSTPKVEASIWENGQQNAYQAFEAGDYKTASEQFETPTWKASALFKDKQYKQAEAIYLTEKTAEPDNKNTLYNLGNAQAMQQKYEEALASFNQALALDPDFKEAQENKAAVEALLKKQKEQEQKNKDQKNDSSSQDKQDQSSDDQQQGDQKQKDQQQNQQPDTDQQKDQQPGQQSDSDQQKGNQQQKDEQQKDQSSESNDQENNQQSSDNQQDQQSDAEQQDNQQQPSSEQKEVQSKQEQQSQQSAQEAAQQEKEKTERKQQQQQQQQQAEESEQDEAEQQAASTIDTEQQSNKEYEDLPQWLKNVPDDPSLLLRNKMQLEYRKRSANKPVLQQNNGEIW